jgi:uncharacterized membrane protein
MGGERPPQQKIDYRESVRARQPRGAIRGIVRSLDSSGAGALPGDNISSSETIGAEEGTRTPTAFRPPAPKAGASANSATSASGKYNTAVRLDCACPRRSVLLVSAASGEFPREKIMPHCTKCGAAVGDGAGFCPACGAAQAAPGAVQSAPPAGVPAASQMDEKVAGLLCYVLWWITGLIFYIIDKRPFVRFHAAQSITLFGCVCVLYFVLGIFLGIGMMAGGFAGLALSWLLYGILNIGALVLWILLMVKAYQGERFRVPFVADISEKIFGKA